MIGFIKKLFGAKPVETQPEVPYKVETSAEVVVAVDPAVNPVVSTTNETVVVKDATPAPAKKAKKAPAAKKPKAPRKPKAPKVAK